MATVTSRWIGDDERDAEYTHSCRLPGPDRTVAKAYPSTFVLPDAFARPDGHRRPALVPMVAHGQVLKPRRSRAGWHP